MSNMSHLATPGRMLTGNVVHARHAPKKHAFHYALNMWELDLDQLPKALKPLKLASYNKRNWVSFKRENYFGDPNTSLATTVRNTVFKAMGERPTGPIRLVTQPAYFGYVQNPISLYFCFQADNELMAIVADVTNTPWGERHQYVLNVRESDSGATLSFTSQKALHVSPFMEMNMEYQWRIFYDQDNVKIGIRNMQDGKHMFDAVLNLTAAPLTNRTLNRALIRFPFMTARIVLGIYWQALKIKLKGIPYVQPPVITTEKDG